MANLKNLDPDEKMRHEFLAYLLEHLRKWNARYGQ